MGKIYNNLIGKVEKVIFYNPQSNWGVFKMTNSLENDELFKDENITVAGNFDGIYEDCTIEVNGEHRFHPKFGDQIVLSFLRIKKELSNKESIINWLSKSSIKGINTQNALRIYKKFEENSIEITLNNTDRLLEVSGIGRKTLDKVKSSVSKYKSMEDLIEYCIPLGFSYSLINKLDNSLGKKAIEVLKDNIYHVLEYTDSITFKQIDTIAINNGLNPEDPNRVKYGFLYTLKNKVMFEGSTGYGMQEIKEEIDKELGIKDINLFYRALNNLEKDNKLYLDGGKIYFKYFYDIEKSIALKIKNLVANNKSLFINEKIMQEEIKNFPFTLNNQQIDTIINCMHNNVSIITGAGGTGKTSILKALSNIFDRSGFNVELLSPTGKASRRIEECTGRPAQTIHKFLGVKTNIEDTDPITIHNNTIIIVDEASMLDIVIFNKLLDSFNDDTRIILIGDNNQLPSVQAGNVLEDLMTYKKISVNILTDIMRQAKNSNIIKYCSKINQGKLIDECVHDDLFFEAFDSRVELLEKFSILFDREIVQSGIDGVQVIMPYKKGDLGVNKINNYIREKYNTNVLDERYGYKLEDKIMHIKNNYPKGVFNGEVGKVTEINNEEDYLEVTYDTGKIIYEIDDIDETILAYTCTVHKVQGSEYPVVFVLLDSENTLLLSRKILYTACSRAKKKLYILSMHNSVEKCILNNYFKTRITKLGSFLNEEVKS